MQRDDAITILRTAESVLRERFAVRSLALFGSVARNQAVLGSDVDLLVEFDHRIGLLHLIATAQYIEQLLAVPRVDLTLRRAVIPELRERIFQEAINVIGKPSVEISATAHARGD